MGEPPWMMKMWMLPLVEDCRRIIPICQLLSSGGMALDEEGNDILELKPE
jgi:hypothetical protein